jgi:hypothetical protein
MLLVGGGGAWWSLFGPPMQQLWNLLSGWMLHTTHLLHVLQCVLSPECVELGWGPGAQAWPDNAFLNPLVRLTTHGAKTSKCMPAIDVGILHTPCMSWHPQGYVLIFMGLKLNASGRMVKVSLRAHTLVCWMFRGQPTEVGEHGVWEVCHMCGHPNCLNPTHLMWVSKWLNKQMAEWHKQNGGRWGQLYTITQAQRDDGHVWH